jgi:hypothetical protein
MKSKAMDAAKFTMGAVNELAILGGIKELASNAAKTPNIQKLGELAVDGVNKISPDTVAKASAVTAAAMVSTASTTSTVIATITSSTFLATVAAATTPVLIVAATGFAVYKVVEWVENN